MIFLLFLIPALVALVLFLLGRRRVTPAEFIMLLIFQGIVLGGTWYFADQDTRGATKDHAVYNGRVREKRRVEVSCVHDYKCNCRQECSSSSEDGTSTCSTECETCYQHAFDVVWNVYSTSGDVVALPSPDPQGLRQPQAWKGVRTGESMAVRRQYENYVRGSREVFLPSPPKGSFSLPGYPMQIRDLYKLDRFVSVGAEFSDVKAWNEGLSELTADLRKANVVVVAVKDQPREYADALRWAWAGGKENDVVLVASLDGQKRIQWAEALAWTTNQRFQVELRDRVEALKTFGREPVLKVLRTTIEQHYAKRPASDFEYLRSRELLTPRQTWISLTISLVVSLLMGAYFYFNASTSTRAEATWGTLITSLIFLGGVGALGWYVVGQIRQDWRAQELDIAVKYHQAQSRVTQVTEELKEAAELAPTDADQFDGILRRALASTSGDQADVVRAFVEERRPAAVKKLNAALEGAQRTYLANATELEDRKRVYQERISTFPYNVLARVLGFPTEGFQKYQLELTE